MAERDGRNISTYVIALTYLAFLSAPLSMPSTDLHKNHVILVDASDQALAPMEKMAAHRAGLLHRAFSVFIFNSNHELLLQKRAATKYHSGGLWTNTCCSHPQWHESILQAAGRRLREEMGFICNNLKPIFSFIYRAELDQNLIEHEFDHVVVGLSDASPNINPDEVADWQYVSWAALEEALAQTPEQFTVWFKIAWRKLKAVWPDGPQWGGLIPPSSTSSM